MINLNKNRPMKLTSVKVPEDLFNDFKIDNVKDKFTIQKLLERSMFLYLKDEEFKEKIKNQFNTKY
jgi:hypothetical protein